MKRILIIGGGFGGVHTALNLRNQFQTTIITSSTDFEFTPLIPDVASGALSYESVRQSIRYFLGNKARLVIGNVNKIVTEKNRVFCGKTYLDYDYLVISSGSVQNFFGVPGAEKYSYPLKTVKDAVNIKSAINELKSFPEQTNVVIIGAGATGIELLGNIMNLPNLRFFLVQAANEILPNSDPVTRINAYNYLISNDVEIITGDPVVKVTKNQVVLKSGKKIKSTLTVWCAGVTPNNLLKKFSNTKGFLLVDSYLRVKGLKNVFALGDCCIIDENPVPLLAQVALQQSKVVAKNIINTVESKPLTKFNYKSKGTIISVGEKFAVAEIYGFYFKGFLPALIKKMVYISHFHGIKPKIRLLSEVFARLAFKRHF